MRVLVSGASGFVGRHLCRVLLEHGHELVALVRPGYRLSEPIQATPRLTMRTLDDIGGKVDWPTILAGTDAMVHLAAIAHRGGVPLAELLRTNVHATLALAEASARAGVRFVFLSTVKVHGEDSGAGAFSEASPLDPGDQYAQSKAQAEGRLRALSKSTGMPLVILRPPLVYGPGVKANFLRMMQWIAAGRPLPLGAVRNRRSLVYVGNLVDAIHCCLQRVEEREAVYLIGDTENVSTPELVLRIGDALARKPRLYSVPPRWLRPLAMMVGRSDEFLRLAGNLVLDSSLIRAKLAWSPPFTQQQGLAETARWFRATYG
jgi:nucleoside-diphosphate-sugar epimerase